ncbi:hypothetical protein [Cupriavidus necator]
MKFSMPGWWEIKLKIDAASGTDEVTFNTIVAFPRRAAGLWVRWYSAKPVLP